jgi:transposase
VREQDEAARRGLRQQAAALFAAGARQADVAREVGVSRVTAMHWQRIWRDSGEAGLLAQRPLGRRPKLNADQMRRIDLAVAQSPRACGFDLDRWSLAAIAALIEKRTGVAYDPRHIGRVLRRMGWSVPPIGPANHTAIRIRFVTDPDGNQICLLEEMPA